MDDNARAWQEYDQAAAQIADNLPTFLWRFYTNLCAAGFTADQAMELAGSHMVAMVMAGRRE